ncbi:alpha/beta hydrolase [Pilimelia columellifera]|uniref:Alpha/beta hydrolase n=1 Tax=Pilimelia columellifera subsp. columellifera TaxID=706583 RepID=A0ABP6ART3_9ACTN
MSPIARLGTMALAGVLGVGLVGVQSEQAAARAWAAGAGATLGRSVASDVTSPEEALRVDRVPTPVPAWATCHGGRLDCAKVTLPLDYNSPNGATVTIALARLRATAPAGKRSPSLFVNPGGPGGSGIALVARPTTFASAALRATFDIVGFDPRGVGASQAVRCHATNNDQAKTRAKSAFPFPVTKAQEQRHVAYSGLLAKNCSGAGRLLAGAMSTAQVARDLELLRRAVGDDKLNYLGFSYGSVLGQQYANLFPDRVRTMVIDGVVDARQWAGTNDRPMFDRIRSGEATARGLAELLKRCAAAGKERCPFAAAGAPASSFETITKRLTAEPLKVPTGKATSLTYRYNEHIALTTAALYDDPVLATTLAAEVWTATSPSASAAAKKKALAAIGKLAGSLGFGVARTAAAASYDNTEEAQLGVMCSDGRHAAKATAWPALAAAADKGARHFGRMWSWMDSPCATSVWKAKDEDAYRGPFDRVTAGPVLVVGNTWDPVTHPANAVAIATLLPNSRMLGSDSWGHTAYGTSRCVTRAIDHYLVTGATDTVPRPDALPPPGLVCMGDRQPYASPTLFDPPGGHRPALPAPLPLMAVRG